MKEKRDKVNELIGYETKSIGVHMNIDDPGYWTVTIRQLGIFAVRLCPLDTPIDQIRVKIYDAIKSRIHQHETILDEL